MRKKIVAIILVVTILYAIVGILLFSNIQLMEAPDILVEVDVAELNSEEAVLHTVINVNNPNSFDIIARNIGLVVTTQDGYEAARVLIRGGNIAANGKKTITEDIHVAFNGHSPENLTTRINGEVGASILFIQKTIPLKMGVVTSIEKLINDFAVPSISVTTNIDNITTDEVNLSADVTAYNPNAFDISVGNISADIENDNGQVVGNLEVIGGVISGKGYVDLNGSGWLLLKAMNAKRLLINVSGLAGAKIAGYEKNLPFNIKINMNIPDLQDVLLPKDSPTILAIKIDRKITLKGSVNNVELEVNNTFKVDLVLRDVICRMYTVVGDEEHFIAENKVEGDVVAVAGKSTFFTTQIALPFSKILTLDLAPDWLMFSVSANLTINGLDPAVYLEIKGYQDLHVIR